MGRLVQDVDMKFSPSRLLTAFLVFLPSCVPVACAGTGNGNHFGHSSVAISPVSCTMQSGASQQFTASVSGTNNQAVNWSVNGTLGGSSNLGTITSSGLYTAPVNPPSSPVSITAQSVTPTAASASATVYFASQPVSVAITPTSASLHIGQSQQFQASISGTANAAVNWLVNGISGGNSSVGSISSAGMYTAPATVPSTAVMVTAQSAYQASASASASVSIMPAGVTVSISPTSATLDGGQVQQFSATISGTNNTGITWLVNGVAGGNLSIGTISSNGIYTAPATSTQVTVTAQSVYQPSSSSSAVVTVKTTTHSVSLSWQDATPSLAGFNIYRASQPSGPFTRLNSSVDTATVYTDTSVQSGQSYYYTTTAVDSSGTESGYSNVAQASIP